MEQQTCHGMSGDLREDLENPRQNSTVKIDLSREFLPNRAHIKLSPSWRCKLMW